MALFHSQTRRHMIINEYPYLEQAAVLFYLHWRDINTLGFILTTIKHDPLGVPS